MNMKSLNQLVKRRIMYISAKFWNMLFKLTILGKVMVLTNCCLNLWSENCILVQIPRACQELCSERLNCFLVSSSSRSLGRAESQASAKFCIFFGIIYKFKFSSSQLFVPKTPSKSQNNHIGNSFQEKFLENGKHVKYKSYDGFVKKRTWNWHVGGKMKLDISSLAIRN